MSWSVAQAKQQISRLVKEAKLEPQWISNRGRMVAAVLGAEEAREYLAWRQGQGRKSLAERFRDLRSLCEHEGYTLEIPARTDRQNPFAHVDDGSL